MAHPPLAPCLARSSAHAHRNLLPERPRPGPLGAPLLERLFLEIPACSFAHHALPRYFGAQRSRFAGLPSGCYSGRQRARRKKAKAPSADDRPTTSRVAPPQRVEPTRRGAGHAGTQLRHFAGDLAGLGARLPATRAIGEKNLGRVPESAPADREPPGVQAGAEVNGGP
jgi:hypothetical protein